MSATLILKLSEINGLKICPSPQIQKILQNFHKRITPKIRKFVPAIIQEIAQRVVQNFIHKITPKFVQKHITYTNTYLHTY